MQRRLAGDGIALIGQLAKLGDRELAARYGRIGARIARLAPARTIVPSRAFPDAKQSRRKTTLAHDEAECGRPCRAFCGRLREVSVRLKQSRMAAGTITLKLKTTDFACEPARVAWPTPTQLLTRCPHHG